MPPVRVLSIFDCQSDGDSARWPTPDKGLTRNDEHFLGKVANERWAKDRSEADLGGPPSIATWRLDRLPSGFAGFEKGRTGSAHIDRFVYGHQRGAFRSINEFYPHFKHLMDNGGPIGCQCKLCSAQPKRPGQSRRTSVSNGIRSVSPTRRSSQLTSSNPPPSSAPHRSQPAQSAPISQARPIGFDLMPHGRLPSPSPPRSPRQQLDEEGTPDVFREVLDSLVNAEAGTVVDQKISEPSSPDWQVGHGILEASLDDWRNIPRFVPRTGEVVLFARDASPNEVLEWDSAELTWRKFDPKAGKMLARPRWEAGVVTQMPLQPVGGNDLASTPDSKSNVAISGFRLEPLAKPGSSDKQISKQHRYVPLHGIRPLVYWRDCLSDLPESEWHETVRNALATSNTFSLVGRDRFTGGLNGLSGPEATIYCNGAYIGSELILTGDTVRLLPSPNEQKPSEVTDAMIITSIRLRIVNIGDAGNDDWDDSYPYTICLHVSGKALTLDRKRSFDGIGKVPILPGSSTLPSGVEGYGQWYHMADPKRTKARLEVPFTRVLGRVHENIAMDTWFHAHASSEASIKPMPKPAPPASDIRRGLSGLVAAREYAVNEDPRIDRNAGKSWFWADTRVEALDLHEVNNRFVGIKDETRTPKQMTEWRKVLKALGGGKSGLADYHAAVKRREAETRKEREGLTAGSYGMVGAAVTVPVGTSGSGTDVDGEAQVSGGRDDLEVMEVDEDESADIHDVARKAGLGDTIELSSDE